MFKIASAFGQRTKLRPICRGLLVAAGMVALLAGPQLARAAIIPETTGYLVFDFLDRDGTQGDNSINIAGAVTGGPADTAFSLNGLQDQSSPDDEHDVPVTFGTSIDFFFASNDPPGPLPDILWLVVLDSTKTNFLITTNDSGGTNHLFDYLFDGSGTLQPYNADVTTKYDPIGSGYRVHIETFPTINGTVPEPASLAIWTVAALGMAVFARRRLPSQANGSA